MYNLVFSSFLCSFIPLSHSLQYSNQRIPSIVSYHIHLCSPFGHLSWYNHGFSDSLFLQSIFPIPLDFSTAGVIPADNDFVRMFLVLDIIHFTITDPDRTQQRRLHFSSLPFVLIFLLLPLEFSFHVHYTVVFHTLFSFSLYNDFNSSVFTAHFLIARVSCCDSNFTSVKREHKKPHYIISTLLVA